MATNEKVLKPWREIATDLQIKGLNENEIFERIWRDYSKVFKNQDSARYRVLR